MHLRAHALPPQYVRPLFRELLRTPFGRAAAVELYGSYGRASYHPICAKVVAGDIEVETAKPALDPRTLRRVGNLGTTAGGSAAPAPVAVSVTTQGAHSHLGSLHAPPPHTLCNRSSVRAK